MVKDTMQKALRRSLSCLLPIPDGNDIGSGCIQFYSSWPTEVSTMGFLDIYLYSLTETL